MYSAVHQSFKAELVWQTQTNTRLFLPLLGATHSGVIHSAPEDHASPHNTTPSCDQEILQQQARDVCSPSQCTAILSSRWKAYSESMQHNIFIFHNTLQFLNTHSYVP